MRSKVTIQNPHLILKRNIKTLSHSAWTINKIASQLITVTASPIKKISSTRIQSSMCSKPNVVLSTLIQEEWGQETIESKQRPKCAKQLKLVKNANSEITAPSLITKTSSRRNITSLPGIRPRSAITSLRVLVSMEIDAILSIRKMIRPLVINKCLMTTFNAWKKDLTQL